ncbi:MAG TPA: hypothetical protein VFM82_03610 [Flavobacteriaceae bacterium]|nr:hypothetical protein [Flavobacteriaceae bacterium]
MDLQELENKVWENNVKQKTIDLVQNAECDFEDEDYTEDEIVAYIYEVGICLEVYDPCLRIDIEILEGLKTILENKQERLKQLDKKEQV